MFLMPALGVRIARLTWHLGGLATHRERQPCQLRRRGIGWALAQIQAAHHAIAVRFHVDMPYAFGTFKQRLQLSSGLAIAGRIITRQGQQYIAGIAHCVGQAFISSGIGRIAEDHVEQDGGGLCSTQAVDQVGVQTTGPRPLSQLLQAGVVDGHQ